VAIQVLVDRETEHPAVYLSFMHPRMRLATPADFVAHLSLSVFEIAVNNRCVPLACRAAGLGWVRGHGPDREGARALGRGNGELSERLGPPTQPPQPRTAQQLTHPQ
jgi:hypothetical protein